MDFLPETVLNLGSFANFLGVSTALTAGLFVVHVLREVKAELSDMMELPGGARWFNYTFKQSHKYIGTAVASTNFRKRFALYVQDLNETEVDEVDGPCKRSDEKTISFLSENDFEYIKLGAGDNSKPEVFSSFDKLSKRIGDRDLFMFVYSGHGDIETGVTVDLLATDISGNELSEQLKKVKSALNFSLIYSCFSGGIAERLSKDGIAISNCEKDRVSQYFPGEKTFDVQFLDEIGKGKSVGEAFDFAALKQQRRYGFNDICQLLLGQIDVPCLYSLDYNPYSIRLI